MGEGADVDMALLEEAAPPPDDVARLRGATLPPPEDAGTLNIGPREAWDSHSCNSDWWRGMRSRTVRPLAAARPPRAQHRWRA